MLNGSLGIWNDIDYDGGNEIDVDASLVVDLDGSDYDQPAIAGKIVSVVIKLL